MSAYARIILLLIFYINVQQSYCQDGDADAISNQLLKSSINIILSTATYEQPAFDESLKQKIQYILSTDKKYYLPCEPIIIHASYTNISENVIRYNRAMDPFIDNKSLSLVKENNEEAQLTCYGEETLGRYKKKNTAFGSSMQTQFLLPQKTSGYIILINRIYDITQDGSYKINLTRTFYDNDSNTYCDITSNTLEITILEDMDNHPVFRYIPPPPVDSSV